MKFWLMLILKRWYQRLKWKWKSHTAPSVDVSVMTGEYLSTMWTYKGEEFTSEDIGDYYGFIYRITNLTTGHDYVGRKYFKSKRKLKPLKGRKNKRIRIVETDWNDYYGSSKRLLEDIEELGKENFTREIIELCTTRGNTNYAELVWQVKEEVLLREDSYNGIIAIKIGVGSVKTYK
jgi:hypothetical protein